MTGLEIAYRYIHPGNSRSIDEMITSKTFAGDEVREVLHKLVFKQPVIHQEGTTLDRAGRMHTWSLSWNQVFVANRLGTDCITCTWGGLCVFQWPKRMLMIGWGESTSKYVKKRPM